MKTFVSVLVGLFTVMLGSIAFAYPPHLGGDPNYIMCDGHMGTGYYLDRSSLVVQQYEPPIYRIAVNVVTVHDADAGRTEISNVRTFQFLYNYDEGNMYIRGNVNGNTNWRYLSPKGSYAETGVVMPAGEMAFYIAYGIPFYGKAGGFSNSFYDRI